jgi:hypothetical protein
MVQSNAYVKKLVKFLCIHVFCNSHMSMAWMAQIMMWALKWSVWVTEVVVLGSIIYECKKENHKHKLRQAKNMHGIYFKRCNLRFFCILVSYKTANE